MNVRKTVEIKSSNWWPYKCNGVILLESANPNAANLVSDWLIAQDDYWEVKDGVHPCIKQVPSISDVVLGVGSFNGYCEYSSKCDIHDIDALETFCKENQIEIFIGIATIE